MSQPFFPPSQNAPESSVRLPLGQKLLRAGLITQAQLAQGLREQHESRLKFGEVCLGHQWLSAEEVYQFTPAYSLAVGEILVTQGYIHFDQLRIALAQQHRYGRKLGEILIWKGWIRPQELETVLEQQQVIRQRRSQNAWQALQGVFLDQPHWLDTPDQKGPNDLDPYAQDEGTLQDETSSLPSDIPGSDPFGGDVWAEFVTPDGARPHRSPGSFQASDPESVLEFARSVECRSGYSEQYYQQKLASLELQLELQQREWDQQANSINQQIAVFQTQYQQRIALLEGELIRQKQDNQALIAEREGLQAQVQQLKAEIQSLLAAAAPEL